MLLLIWILLPTRSFALLHKHTIVRKLGEGEQDFLSKKNLEMNASKFGYHSDQGALGAFSGGQICQLSSVLFKKENTFKPYNLYQLL